MAKMAEKLKIAFLGAGNMAGAIINSIDKSTADIYAYDINPAAYDKLDSAVIRGENAAHVVELADYIFISVKPQNKETILTDIKNHVSPEIIKNKIFISIMAGVTMSTIIKLLDQPNPIKVIRTIPNMPMMINKGVVALTKNEYVADCEFDTVTAIFKKVGEILIVPEEHINAITSVTSSAPAYVYLFIKGIHDAARKQGLDYDNMLEIICHMVSGSAEMLLHTGKSPDELIKMVASPNGTTEAAFTVFNNSDFLEIMDKAINKCTKRAEELSAD